MKIFVVKTGWEDFTDILARNKEEANKIALELEKSSGEEKPRVWNTEELEVWLRDKDGKIVTKKLSSLYNLSDGDLKKNDCL